METSYRFDPDFRHQTSRITYGAFFYAANISYKPNMFNAANNFNAMNNFNAADKIFFIPLSDIDTFVSLLAVFIAQKSIAKLCARCYNYRVY